MLAYSVLDSPAWRDLSPAAQATYILIAKKFNGKNNGNLSLTNTELKGVRGLRSPTTLRKALDELWIHGLISLTREGCYGSTRICNLWALTFWRINAHDGLGIQETKLPSHDWRDWRPSKPAENYIKYFPKIEAKRNMLA